MLNSPDCLQTPCPSSSIPRRQRSRREQTTKSKRPFRDRLLAESKQQCWCPSPSLPFCSRFAYCSFRVEILNTLKIAESFRRFGITPTTANLLVIKVSTASQPYTAEAVQAHLTANFEGEQVEFSDELLGLMTDLARVRKIYKLNSGGGKSLGKGTVNRTSKDFAERELEVLILGSMALRGATN